MTGLFFFKGKLGLLLIFVLITPERSIWRKPAAVPQRWGRERSREFATQAVWSCEFSSCRCGEHMVTGRRSSDPTPGRGRPNTEQLLVG